MSVVIVLIGYFILGISLVQGALYISQYDLERKGFARYRIIAFIASLWPLFLILMVSYWCWAGYHKLRQWIRTL